MKTVFQSVIVVMIIISYQYGSAQSSANSEVPVLSLNHIAMYVNDLKKSTAFYENILGLKQIPEPFHDGKHTWFTIGAAGSLHLIQGAPANISRDKNDHLCFSVKSIDEFIANLNKHKIEYTNWPGTEKA
ncbi:MAG TPA: VOC family protein, partial [Chryseolinea sp.]|nr:VOC family protein [Chryseolinea sp.]